ncbi:carotenoid isomerooxygenase isoform X1 [Glossina fuscipes]|uniref:Carotenoid isomerooxygenase isoform X1 n=1 Tax=Glossina fuscipes TaxID=7396 RepID=A0A9C5ZI65_9MUSC|nr:carotenoid isomerooxygenase isoform X1 [Glossina fuscipes]
MDFSGFLLIFGIVIILLRSKKFYTWISLRLKLNAQKRVKYNAKDHDPESARIDGNGRCYPNCDSTVWLRSCREEIIEPIEGHVIGKIPDWIKGSLLRNGPGNWKVGDMSFQHLFDCSALIHRFAIKNGHVTYQNRFVQTNTLKKNLAAQRIVVTEFGTSSVPDPCHSIFEKVGAIFRADNGSDNTMISIYPFGDEFYTFTEAPFIHRINPRTLATEDRVCISDYAGVVNHTSHPHVMPNGTVYNLGMASTKSGPVYNVICFPRGDSMFEEARVVASIPCRWKLNPSYMHTFGITENYFIIVEQPLTISVMEYLKAHFCNHNLSACLKWFDNKPVLFHVIDRNTGQLRYTFHSETFFYLHIINQYEQDDHIVIDICCYKDPEMINCMYLESMTNMQSNPNYAALFRSRPLRFVLPVIKSVSLASRSSKQKSSNRQRLIRSITLMNITNRLQQPRIKQSESQYADITFLTTSNKLNYSLTNSDEAEEPNDYKVDSPVNMVGLKKSRAQAFQLSDGRVFVKPELLCEMGCETPRIHYENYLGKPYRYFYAISSDVDAENPGTLIKVDVLNKTCKQWCESDCYPSEPIFVPAPNKSGEIRKEDDGVVLASMVWGGFNENKVGLLVLCARTWTEIGRCVFHTSGPVPKCLHGWFARDIV